MWHVKLNSACEQMEQVALFLAKVVALEVLRRGSNAKCRPIWWGLQGISLLQTPPLRWLQRWNHVRRLTECTQVCLTGVCLPAGVSGQTHGLAWLG